MAYTAPVTHNSGDLITASDWNTYLRDNFNSLTGLIGYVNSATPLSGWSEFTTARGMFILAAVSGGTLATAVGTPLTNQQNVTHTHTLDGGGWGSGGTEQSGQLVTGSRAGGQGNATDSAAKTSSSVSAGSIGIPYIQLTCIQKD